MKSDIARAASHNLNDVTSRVRFAGVAEFINKLDYGVHSGIEADSILGGGNIVIDGSRDSYAGDAVCGKLGRAAEGAVAADRNNTVYTKLVAGIDSLLHTLLGLELKATVGIKDSTALVDYVRNVTESEVFRLVIDKSRVTAIYRYDLNAPCERGTGYCSYCGIHAGRISSGGKHAYSFKCFHFNDFLAKKN